MLNRTPASYFSYYLSLFSLKTPGRRQGDKPRDSQDKTVGKPNQLEQIRQNEANLKINKDSKLEKNDILNQIPKVKHTYLGRKSDTQAKLQSKTKNLIKYVSFVSKSSKDRTAIAKNEYEKKTSLCKRKKGIKTTNAEVCGADTSKKRSTTRRKMIYQASKPPTFRRQNKRPKQRDASKEKRQRPYIIKACCYNPAHELKETSKITHKTKHKFRLETGRNSRKEKRKRSYRHPIAKIGNTQTCTKIGNILNKQVKSNAILSRPNTTTADARANPTNLKTPNKLSKANRAVKYKSTRTTSGQYITCLLYTSPSPRDRQKSRMPSSA